MENKNENLSEELNLTEEKETSTPVETVVEPVETVEAAASAESQVVIMHEKDLLFFLF